MEIQTSAKERIKSQFQEQFGEETDMVAAGAYVEVKPHTVFVTIEDDNDPTRTWPNPEELSRIQDSNWEIGKIETDRIWVDRGSEPMDTSIIKAAFNDVEESSRIGQITETVSGRIKVQMRQHSRVAISEETIQRLADNGYIISEIDGYRVYVDDLTIKEE